MENRKTEKRRNDTHAIDKKQDKRERERKAAFVQKASEDEFVKAKAVIETNEI